MIFFAQKVTTLKTHVEFSNLETIESSTCQVKNRSDTEDLSGQGDIRTPPARC